MRRVCVVAAAVLFAGCDAAREPATVPADRAEAVSPLEVAPPPRPSCPVEVTPAAAAAIRRHLTEHGGTLYLRVRVVPGGCPGFRHGLDLDPVAAVGDHTLESGGVRVVVAARQSELLRGTRVDFGQVGDKEGFTIKNPNFDGEAAKRSLEVLCQQPVAE